MTALALVETGIAALLGFGGGIWASPGLRAWRRQEGQCPSPTQALADMEEFYLEMVKTLARAVDSKDSYTHEHSERASVKARRLAARLGVAGTAARYVEYAALLHDIGKIGIDEAILLKPGKLTPEEYEVMKKHPIIGHQILSPVKYLGPVAEMVLYHQEWYNGQGYPEGRKGEEIPIGARIVAVIDAWDAMTSDRPYRKALRRDVAISELRRGAGTQFDPQVVEAFLAIEESLEAEKERRGNGAAPPAP
jgi:HD-GYP domain-containing protein (c-di-GMP phosphodiesterase class II)